MEQNARRITRNAILILVVTGILGYAYLETRHLLNGPIITVVSPKNGSTVEDSLVLIKGRAQNIASLFLDNRQIFTDVEGNFEEKLSLPEGYNIIEIKAHDRIGREKNVRLEIVYKHKS